MAPRAYWKGYLKLSLVSCPIALYPATSSSEKVSFNRINKKTGHRLKQLQVDAETGEPVEREDIGRGYEVAKGQYIPVEDEQFDPKKFEDHYENALVKLLRDKSAGRPVEPVEEAEAPRVINLMDALRASIKGEVKKPAAASTGA